MNAVRDIDHSSVESSEGRPGRSRTPAVDRAVRVLKALKAAGGRLRLSDLSVQLGLSKSTLSDLLATMEESELVERDPVSRTFRLGPALAELGLAAQAVPDLVTAARPELSLLRETTGETAILHVPSGAGTVLAGNVIADSVLADTVIVDACESRHQLKVVAPIGHRLPPLAGSVAKVLLAAASEDRLGSLVTPGSLPAFTSRSITDHRRYCEQLRLVRRCGYASDDEEYLPGVRAASAPIVDAAGATTAVITVVAASSRLARDRLPALGGQVKAAAARVSVRLGARPLAQARTGVSR